jgi:tungstate transport system ATP-binding protein
MSDYILEMRHVVVDRGTQKKVLNIDEFVMHRGELVALVGPNGAGKSTFLQTVNLLFSYQGKLRLFGQDVGRTNKTALRRRCALVFQETLLLNDTVFNNVGLALRFRGVAADETKRKVFQALADFRCDHLADRPAHLLSGGEAQRVCLARAIVSDPELLLLDEPFASQDAFARGALIEEIRQLAEARGISVILVSHNFSDVLHFAERAIAVLNGVIVQDDKPEYIMRRPVNEQVARLVGMDNIIPCSLEGKGQDRFIKLVNGIRFLYSVKPTDQLSVCCLPGDALYLCDDSFPSDNLPMVVLEGAVERVIPGIGTCSVLVRSGEMLLNVRISRNQANMNIQDKIKVAFNPAEAHIV